MKTLAALAVLLCLSPRPVAMDEEQPRQTFRASVALVPITAVVRDSRNRLVRDLTRDDFQVLENGRPKPIVDFKATDRAPVSLALLLDTSGSMRGSNLDRARRAADHLLNLIDRTSDEVALFTFDKAVREEAGFTNEPDTIRRALGNTDAWGLTSLYDAIADTAKRLEDRHTQRRAVVVITDGIDTSSTRTAAQVSGLASAIDVPVYVITVAEPPPPGARPVDDASLVELAFWTGGDVKPVIIPDLVGTTIAELMDELRQQYFLAIESAASDAWHRLEIKARPENLQVRARSGYFGMRSARSRPGAQKIPG